MKTPIGQDVSKEMESKPRPPSIVARLMGLDVLPTQQTLSQGQRNSREVYLHNTALGLNEPQHLQGETFARSGASSGYWQQENNLPEIIISPEMHQPRIYEHKKQEYKDVYEVQQSAKVNKFKPQRLQKGRYNENLAENKMDLVRQKFMEAKRLATNEKLRHSPEFQDALEVLSSNRDFFLKFLQEPNSLLSKQLHSLQSIPQSKHITVLKPSKNLAANGLGKQWYASVRCAGSDMKNEEQIRKQDPGTYPFRKQHQVGANGQDKDKPSRAYVSSGLSSCERPVVKADNFSQPTRIVILKPSFGKPQDIKALVSSPTSSPRTYGKNPYVSNAERFQGSVTDGIKGSREIAKDITRQMCESLSFDSMCISDRRDETLLSSALSNGYVGDESSFVWDESSFNKSENKYLDAGNLSDSEVTTPTSRHSWDHINKYSPYSSSSFSRASGSPESSVSREAKKRLSERWAMMGSGSQEQWQVQRSSTTLGEMLTLPEIKKPIRSSEKISDGGLSISNLRSQGEEEPTCLPNSSRKDEIGEEASRRNLPRSRSVPVSSTIYENVRLQGEAPEADVGNSVSKEANKLKNGRSFKGKISNLFFSMNRKSKRKKTEKFALIGSQGGTTTEDSQGGECVIPETQADVSGSMQCSAEKENNDDNSQYFTNDSLNGLLGNVRFACKDSLPASIWVGIKDMSHSAEAVLSQTNPGTAGNPTVNQNQPSPVSVFDLPFEDDLSTPQCSDKACSSSQESDLRPLLRVDPDLAADPQSFSGKSILISFEAEEEHEKFLFVRNVLSASGLDYKQSVTDTSRWYLPNHPLDPSLLEIFGDQKEYDRHQQEAKRRQQRSERRLLFDSVNAALVEIVGPILDFSPWLRGTTKGAVDENASLAEEVWGWISNLFSGETQRFSGEGDLVDLAARKEMVGPGWVEMLGLEMTGIGREIESVLMDELLEDAVSELIGGRINSTIPFVPVI